MESYRQDVPNELWDELTHEYTECGEYLELQPSETYAKALLPKSNISYITLKVLPRHD
jgi:hypothetical protein